MSKPRLAIGTIIVIILILAVTAAKSPTVQQWIPAVGNSATPEPSLRPASPARPSWEVIGPGSENHFFHTEESAKRAGVRRYGSGPCQGYYEGEEWFCNPKQRRDVDGGDR